MTAQCGERRIPTEIPAKRDVSHVYGADSAFVSKQQADLVLKILGRICQTNYCTPQAYFHNVSFTLSGGTGPQFPPRSSE